MSKAFERWTADNIKIYIYSSGSVAAQKLLFANSEHGDLTLKISGYFDTNIGAKQDKSSYEKIIEEIGCEPADILFLTDIVNGTFFRFDFIEEPTKFTETNFMLQKQSLLKKVELKSLC